MLVALGFPCCIGSWFQDRGSSNSTVKLSPDDLFYQDTFAASRRRVAR